MSADLFDRASASKALTLSSILCTLLVTYFDVSSEGLSFTRPQSPLRFVKNVFLSQTAFRRAFPELILGVGLIYVFRHLERLVGSRKFVSFLTASSCLSLTLQVCFLLFVQADAVFTPGPFGPIFSLFVLYFWHVPNLGMPLVGNIKFNHKIPVYACGLFLCSIEGRNSVLPALLSLFSGVVVYSRFRSLNMPDSVSKFGAQFIDPLVRSEPMATPPRAAAAAAGVAPGPRYGGVNQNHYAEAGVAIVNEEDVEQLVQMGCDRQAAIDALRRNGNDVNRAADSLF